ncbi:MAG: hypothetical protein ABJN84_02440 [Flavobacteriaceae bacterium]
MPTIGPWSRTVVHGETCKGAICGYGVCPHLVKGSGGPSGYNGRGQGHPIGNWQFCCSQQYNYCGAGVSVDYMLGRERFGKYDNDAVKRLEGIQKMDANSQSKLFDIIDTYIRDSKARAAYGS